MIEAEKRRDDVVEFSAALEYEWDRDRASSWFRVSLESCNVVDFVGFDMPSPRQNAN